MPQTIQSYGHCDALFSFQAQSLVLHVLDPAGRRSVPGLRIVVLARREHGLKEEHSTEHQAAQG